jgi:hypothetical protein
MRLDTTIAWRSVFLGAILTNQNLDLAPDADVAELPKVLKFIDTTPVPTYLVSA